jgi:hypothetical protein
MAMVCLPLNYVPGWQDLEAAVAQALDASDVLDEISTIGAKAVAVVGDISQRSTAASRSCRARRPARMTSLPEA